MPGIRCGVRVSGWLLLNLTKLREPLLDARLVSFVRGPVIDAAREAIRQACLLRFRPIVMTTMTALLSGVALMLSHGSGSELRQPLGYSMVGGLALSQVLTLFTTPVIYLYLDRFQDWLRGHKEEPQQPQEALPLAAE